MKTLRNKLTDIHMAGGNVPGGHNVIYDGIRKPFITPMKECNSIELWHSDVVVDIGAYVGTYAIRCARFPVRKVIAYEPTPFTYGILAKTRLVNFVPYHAAIVGDNSRKVRLYLSDGIGVTNSLVPSSRKPTTIDVDAVNYLKAIRGASIVKIDIEGGEYDLPIVQDNLRAIIIDFHKTTDPEWKDKAFAIMEELEEAGFEAVIKPTFQSGWSLGGSWLRRDVKEDKNAPVNGPLIRGELCCGCGTRIRAKRKAICPTCYKVWSKKHSAGFEIGELR